MQRNTTGSPVAWVSEKGGQGAWVPEEDAPVAWVGKKAWVGGTRGGTTLGVCCTGVALDPAFAGAFAIAGGLAAPLKVLS